MPPSDISTAEILMTPPLYHVHGVMSFIFGLIVGSFLNVVIYRLPLGMSVNNPKRSFCFRCGTMIEWFDNIPVLSYFLLRGRCRACGQKFSPRYALVELLTGVIFAAIWYAYNDPVATGFAPLTFWYFVFAACLVVGTFTDFDHWIIPPSVPRLGTALAIVAALVAGFVDRDCLVGLGGPFPALRVETDWFDRILSVMMGPSYFTWRSPEILWWEPVANSLIGAIFAPFLVYGVGLFGKILFRKEAMGFGDVELFVMIGAAMGPVNSVLVLVLASFFGSFAGLVGILITKSKLDRSPMRSGELSPEELAKLDKPKSHGSIAAPEDEEWNRTSDFAASLGMQLLDLRNVEPSNEALAKISAETATRLRVLPLQCGDRIRLAVEDPLSTKMVTELRGLLDLDVEFVIAVPSQLKSACEYYYSETGRPVTAQPKEQPLWRRYYELAGNLDHQAPSHHLPFIPWITLAALVIAIFQPLARLFLNHLFLPV